MILLICGIHAIFGFNMHLKIITFIRRVLGLVESFEYRKIFQITKNFSFYLDVLRIN